MHDYHSLQSSTEEMGQTVIPEMDFPEPGQGRLNRAMDFTYRALSHERVLKDDFSNYIKNGDV